MEKWNYWHTFPDYGDLLYKRATGTLDEMECSKSESKLIADIYKPGMQVLDVGCGAGHYYRSFKERIDPDISFTGVDVTPYYIELANKAFGKEARFMVGDIYDLQFSDDAFDIVLCNNTIQNLPPPPTQAIKELLRVSSKYVIMRVLVGERNYIIQKVRTAEEVTIDLPEKDLISPNGELQSYNYLNIYTQSYYQSVIENLAEDVTITFKPDTDWQSFDNTINTKGEATKIINGMQISGNLILNWQYIILEKR